MDANSNHKVYRTPYRSQAINRQKMDGKPQTRKLANVAQQR